MKLPVEVRLQICKLLDDGETYDDIRECPEINAVCEELGLTLHNCSFLAYRNGNEFDEYQRRRREWNDDLQRRKIAARLVTEEGGSLDIARLADYELMQICLDKLQSGEDLDPKELRAISGAVASYNRNQMAAEKENEKRAFAEREAGYQAEIAKLSALIETQAAQLRELAGSVDGAAVADEMSRRLGLAE